MSIFLYNKSEEQKKFQNSLKITSEILLVVNNHSFTHEGQPPKNPELPLGGQALV